MKHFQKHKKLTELNVNGCKCYFHFKNREDMLNTSYQLSKTETLFINNKV